MEKYDVVIEPKTGWFDIDLEGLWKYRDLILLFVKRNFIAQYKQTILGPAWAVIQPMLTTVIFTVVFGSMAGLSADGVPSFLFYMSGTIAWTYFSTCLTKTADTFTGNARIFGKVYFPRLVMPISTVLTNLIAFSIQFAMFFGFPGLLYSKRRGPSKYLYVVAPADCCSNGNVGSRERNHYFCADNEIQGFKNVDQLRCPALDVWDTGRI